MTKRISPRPWSTTLVLWKGQSKKQKLKSNSKRGLVRVQRIGARGHRTL